MTGMLVFFTNLSFMEFQVRYLALLLLFSVIGGFGWFWMGNLLKNTQLMLLMSSFRVHSWSYTFPIYINDLPDDVICNIVIYADDTTLYSTTRIDFLT